MRRKIDWGAFALTVVMGATLVTAGLTSAFAPVTTGVSPTAEGAEPTQSPTARPERQTDVVRAVAPGDVRAEFVSKTAPPVIHTGQTTKVVMLFRNTGSVEWIKGSAAEARLGVIGDSELFQVLGMAIDWPVPNRPAIQGEGVVLPGGMAQFSFRIQGTEPGRYQVRVGPVIDGVAWAGASTLLDVTVR